jgi:hypothetical protein
MEYAYLHGTYTGDEGSNGQAYYNYMYNQALSPSICHELVKPQGHRPSETGSVCVIRTPRKESEIVISGDNSLVRSA